jgi:hypothetical protein
MIEIRAQLKRAEKQPQILRLRLRMTIFSADGWGLAFPHLKHEMWGTRVHGEMGRDGWGLGLRSD